MTTRKTRQISSALLGKGFQQSDNDHKWFIFFYQGKKSSIRTKISHGLREYGDDLLSSMAHQVRLSKKDLLNLIDCPMTKEDYQRHLLLDQHIKP